MENKKIVRTHYNALDGLRAFAAIGIVLFHVMYNISPSVMGSGFVYDSVIAYFGRFVLLFMMVSAFSLCCGYYERIKVGIVTPDAFYKKRYLRILPFYLLMMLLDFVTEPTGKIAGEIFTNSTLCFKLIPKYESEVIGVGWFLGIIFLFYILFPFFVFMLSSKKRGWISLVISLVILKLALIRNVDINCGDIIFDIPFFITGGLIYLYRNQLTAIIHKNNAISILVTVIWTVLFFSPKGWIIPEMKSYGFLWELCMAAVWLIYAVGSQDRLLNNKFVKYISGISMEIYLCHMLFFRVIEKVHLNNYIHNPHLLFVVTFIIVLCGAVVFSHIIKYFVLDKLTKRIANRN